MKILFLFLLLLGSAYAHDKNSTIYACSDAEGEDDCVIASNYYEMFFRAPETGGFSRKINTACNANTIRTDDSNTSILANSWSGWNGVAVAARAYNTDQTTCYELSEQYFKFDAQSGSGIAGFIELEELTCTGGEVVRVEWVPVTTEIANNGVVWFSQVSGGLPDDNDVCDDGESNTVTLNGNAVDNSSTTGPDGIEYPLYIDMSSTFIAGREPGSYVVENYNDATAKGHFGFDTTGYHGADRTEFHVRSAEDTLDFEYGKVLWIGWSQYHDEYGDPTNSKSDNLTVNQFRSQPSCSTLTTGNGYASGTESDCTTGDYNDGGPDIGILMQNCNSDTDRCYVVEIRDSDVGCDVSNNCTTGGYSVTTTEVQTLVEDTWYDIIMKIYPNGDSSEVKVWVYEVSDTSNLTAYDVTDTPDVNYIGGLYDYSELDTNSDPTVHPYSMQLRWGHYRYNLTEAGGGDCENVSGETCVSASTGVLHSGVGNLRQLVCEPDISCPDVFGFDTVKPKGGTLDRNPRTTETGT